MREGEAELEGLAVHYRLSQELDREGQAQEGSFVEQDPDLPEINEPWPQTSHQVGGQVVGISLGLVDTHDRGDDDTVLDDDVLGPQRVEDAVLLVDESHQFVEEADQVDL